MIQQSFFSGERKADRKVRSADASNRSSQAQALCSEFSQTTPRAMEWRGLAWGTPPGWRRCAFLFVSLVSRARRSDCLSPCHRAGPRQRRASTLGLKRH